MVAREPFRGTAPEHRRLMDDPQTDYFSSLEALSLGVHPSPQTTPRPFFAGDAGARLLGCFPGFAPGVGEGAGDFDLAVLGHKFMSLAFRHADEEAKPKPKPAMVDDEIPIYVAGDTYDTLAEAEADRDWTHTRKRLGFCTVTQDGDDEGCLRGLSAVACATDRGAGGGDPRHSGDPQADRTRAGDARAAASPDCQLESSGGPANRRV